MSKLYTIVFIGRFGCGKGTQSALLKDRINAEDLEKKPILYIETGEKFRQFFRSNGFSADVARALYEKDERQPDFIACYMWGKMLLEELDKDMHLVFDGVARSLPEAQVLGTALEFYSRAPVTVIYLDVSREWSEERLLSRGRADDSALSKINKRLDWFDRDVVPAIEYFKSHPSYAFLHINGEQPIEKVHQDIVSKMKSSQ